MAEREDDKSHPDLASAPTAVVAPSERDVATDHTIVAAGTNPSVLPTLRAAPSSGSSADSTRPLGRPRRNTAQDLATELAGERYELRGEIGRGGMGEVLVAHDRRIGRDVAVKRIRGDHPTAEDLGRFVREARVQGRLEHPAVVPVHDLAVDAEGRPYFVMKRLTGTELHELLKKLRTGDEPDEAGCRRRMLRAFVDVCLAVELAHSRGIVHRDLKPANIMLGDFGEVYVLDWGVARAVTDLDDTGATPSGQHDLVLEGGETRLGTVLGTPAYMAPEQLAGDRAGPAADIYALGCILYEIAAGVPLHTRARSLGQALEPSDARPSVVRPDSPPELDAICKRATALEPTERFTTARAMSNAVQAYLDGDRDIAVRRELALHHLAEARAQLEAGEDETHRRAAMQAAGRALALDPTATAAADLITHLMLRPPKEIPAEVEQQLVAIDTETARQQGRLAALSVLGYLGFVPILLWTGVRTAWVVPTFVALVVVAALQVFSLTKMERISKAGIYLNACLNAALIGFVCRMVGPFIIAPTLVITTLIAYAAHPQFGRIRVVAPILALAVVVPWLLELAGVLSPTYHFEDGRLVLESSLVAFTQAPVELAFILLLVLLSGVVAMLSRMMARRQRDATRRLEIQAWLLRQIVPTSAR